MKKLWLILAISGVILTVLPLILVFLGELRLEETYGVIAVGTVLWLVGRWELVKLKKKHKP